MLSSVSYVCKDYFTKSQHKFKLSALESYRALVNGCVSDASLNAELSKVMDALCIMSADAGQLAG